MSYTNIERENPNTAFWKEIFKLSYHKTGNIKAAKKEADYAVKALKGEVDE